MSWTDERIATLTKMWESGATASQIADELGGVSPDGFVGIELWIEDAPDLVQVQKRLSQDGQLVRHVDAAGGRELDKLQHLSTQL